VKAGYAFLLGQTHGLYRKHLLAVHGLLRGLVLIVVGHVNQVVRPKLKLH
jgi:NADH dehydrogenase